MNIFSKTQLSIFNALALGELSLADISRQTGLSKPNLSSQLSQLEKDGWLTRRQVGPKRIYYKVIQKDIFESLLAKQHTELIDEIYKNPTTGLYKPRVVAGFELNLTDEQKHYLNNNFRLKDYPNSEEQITPELFAIRYKHAEIGLLTHSFGFINEDILKSCKNLKHVVSMVKFASEYIDKDIFTRCGISYWDLSKPDTNFIRSSSVEFLISSVLSLLRPTIQAEQELKFTGISTASMQQKYMGEELAGKTVGIIGTENSAKFSAPILQQLGAKTIFADPDSKHGDPLELGVERFYSVTDMFKTADIVIYTDNYYKNTPILTDFLNEEMRTRYLLILGEYPYDKQFMQACRKLIISKKLSGIHLDYWSARRYAETATERFNLLSDIMYFPNVRITPFMGFKNVQSNIRRNQYTIDILRDIKERYYA